MLPVSRQMSKAGDWWTSSTIHSPVTRAYPRAASADFFITTGTSLFFQRTKKTLLVTIDFASESFSQVIVS
jgi:hypothetical protein